MLALDLFCGAGGAAMGMWRGGMFSTIVRAGFGSVSRAA